MIILKVTGGLGNQMFQYSAAKALSLKTKVPLLLDLDAINSDDLRNFELGIFAIDEQPVSPKLYDTLFPRKGLLRQKRKKDPTIPTFREKSFEYDATFGQIVPPVYIEGYFQSESYFNASSDKIKKLFEFPNNIHATTQKLLEECSNKQSVSIHFRRGDYVTNEKTNAYHGTCSLEYYSSAIAQMQKEVVSPHFFIVSDDIEWVSQLEVLKDIEFTLVEPHREKKDWEDMFLMSACKHNVIANSSFSWWGAWLNSNPDKKVIAPATWFKKTNINTSDLLPKTWHKI